MTDALALISESSCQASAILTLASGDVNGRIKAFLLNFMIRKSAVRGHGERTFEQRMQRGGNQSPGNETCQPEIHLTTVTC